MMAAAPKPAVAFLTPLERDVARSAAETVYAARRALGLPDGNVWPSLLQASELAITRLNEAREVTNG